MEKERQSVNVHVCDNIVHCSPFIREVQIQMTVEYLFMPIRITTEEKRKE